MTTSLKQSPVWYHAATLTERLATRRSARRVGPDAAVDAGLAARRLQRWREQSPFDREDFFARRLAMDQLGEDELLYLLGEPIAAVSQRFPAPPLWLDRFTNLFESSPNGNAAATPAKLRLMQTAGFLEVVSPLIESACASLRRGLAELRATHTAVPLPSAEIESSLFANLCSQLLGILGRTLILELNVARVEGALSGRTSEERFASFIERLGKREHALAILSEYPVLARLLMNCADNWLNFNLEFFRYLCEDWAELKPTFSPMCDPGQLTALKTGAGDSHRRGRSVIVAQFTSGFQFVYKPRALSVDAHLQQLLSWLNERGNHPPFRTTKVLDRRTHGWMEFIGHADCESAAGLQRFYERQGGYIALLYALEAVDFHFENLIAAGEHPVLIDLESLFHPRLDDGRPTDAVQLAWKALNRSVLRIGLLPQRLWFDADNDGIDLSGLGTVAGQLSPFKAPYWEDAGTDEMRFARKRMSMPGGQNRPQLQGQEVHLPDYAEAIITGFNAVYRTLLQHRAELASAGGPLAIFDADEVRVILRPTKTYATLLQESYHPHMLRDALDRDRFFDRLWLNVEHMPSLARVIPAERQDLLSGDIPVFTTTPRAHDFWTSTGEQIADIVQETGMNLVFRKLAQLSEDDLAAQSWFIRASFTSLTMGVENAQMPAYQVCAPESRAAAEQYLAGAEAVGDRLDALALRGEEGDAAWIGLSLMNERNWLLMPLAFDLYNGLPGIALFLAYLGRVSGKSRYTDLAAACLLTLQQNIEVQQATFKGIGGFSGWGGVIYALTHLGYALNQPALITQAHELVELIPPLVAEDQMFDVMGGAAGCIGSLVSLYRVAPAPRVREVAVQCGDHLLAHAQAMSAGLGWYSQRQAHCALTGYSHGAAGISWALAQIFALTGAERFRTAALGAVAYERSLYSPEAKNWPDLRRLGPDAQLPRESFPAAWCHGAPGIGMGRLQSWPLLGDDSLLDEVNVALDTTLACGFGQNHCLCHGDLGNLEFVLQVSETFAADERLRERVSVHGSAVLKSINERGYLTGIPAGVESPGLLTGIAGIGYGLLRLAAPALVPSVLTLAPPHA